MIKKKEHRKVSCDIYRCGVMVFCGCSHEYIMKTLEEYTFSEQAYQNIKDGEALLEEGNEGCCLKADADIIILLPEPKLGTIVHESFHAADMILRDRDVELIGNGEAYAYLIEYIVTKITQ